MMKKHILVVDDEPMLGKLYQALLENYGYTSEIAGNSEEAWTNLAQKNYDALLLDYMMPGINGLTVLQHIQQQYPFLPVVMITGHIDEQIRTKALKSGARVCLYKPFNCIEFEGALACLLGTTPLRAVVSQHIAMRRVGNLISHQENYGT
ncbi:MAG: response regulator [Nitrospirales bacterium]|nr:response regulator [Nitrospirales bacterium]